MKCYYAHCMSIYGTLQESRDINTLEALGFEVVNPNNPEYQERYKLEGMQLFVDLAKNCDCIAFRSLPDGSIPAGIAKEIMSMKDMSKPIIELPSQIQRRILDVEQTREYLSEIGQR